MTGQAADETSPANNIRTPLASAGELPTKSPTMGSRDVHGWQPIETAPKDGSYILALVAEASDRWEHLNGRAFVIRHEGRTVSDYDLGWAVYPGFGGVPDLWFSHWMPLPAPPLDSPRTAK